MKSISSAAFPSARAENLARVSALLVPSPGRQGEGEFAASCAGEILLIPYRIYGDPPPAAVFQSLPPVEQQIVACWFTRHHDGHVRERFLRTLATFDRDWVIAYVVPLCDEYVVELLSYISEHRELFDRTALGSWLRENVSLHTRTRSRVRSYWNCYHRSAVPCFGEFVGAHLLAFSMTASPIKKRTIFIASPDRSPPMKMKSLLLAILLLPLSLYAAEPPADSPTTAKEAKDPAMTSPEDVAGLPNVLIIGDSVSIGYTVPTRQLLKGKANVHRPATNCSSTGYGLPLLKAWMGDKKWAVIHFNFGLHDAKLPPEGIRYASPEDYEKNLREIVALLKATGAKLIFATTTPVPNGGVISPTRRFGSIDQYNTIAKKVMAENGVAIDDLNQAIAPEAATVQIKNDVHFNAAGYALLAKQVAASVDAALK